MPQPADSADDTAGGTVTVAPLATDAASHLTLSRPRHVHQKTGPHRRPPSPRPRSLRPPQTYYMRGRLLLGIILVLVVGSLYWVLANVFGIDLWARTVGQVWGTSGATEASTPAVTSAAVESIPLAERALVDDLVVSVAVRQAATGRRRGGVIVGGQRGTGDAGTSAGTAGVVEVATGDGQVLKKQLTDKTAATLLDMMAAVKRG